jgi:hypothetical protein
MSRTALRRFLWAGAVAVLMPATLLAAQKPDKNAKDAADAAKPKMSLKASPSIAMSPARVVLTAELVGGANDFEDFYCPTVTWEWGDGTESESTSDCPPYEPGKSEVKRRFTVEHVFRTGTWRVNFRLKQRTKSVGYATVSVQIRPGLRDIGQ